MDNKQVILSDVAIVNSGATFPTLMQGEKEGQYPYYKVSDMNTVGNEVLMSVAVNYVDEDARKELNAKVIERGSIVFPKVGAALRTNKKRLLKYDSCMDNNMMAITTMPSKVLPAYLYHLLIRTDLMRFANDANPPSMRKAELERWKISLPPLEEQQRIVEILDRAENIKRLRQQAIETTQRIAPALFYEMFGNPVKNEKGWEISTLGSVSTIVRGASPRPIKEYLGGSVPWIKIGDATKGNDFYIRNTKEHITEEGAERSVVLDKGAVILSNSASIGFARILAMKGCIHDGWLSIDEYDKVFVDVFLIYLLDAFKGYLEHLAPHGTQKNLNTGILKNLEVPKPPIDEQREFVERVNTLNEHLQHQLESERQTKQLSSTLSAQLLAS